MPTPVSSRNVQDVVGEEKRLPNMDSLPRGALVCLARQLNYADAKNFRQVAKRYYAAEHQARHIISKRLSTGRVCKRRNSDWRRLSLKCGMLEIGHEFKKQLRRTPPRVLRQVDLTGISYPQSDHFASLLQDLDQETHFERVCKLDLANCVVDLRDLQAYASLMPAVWCIRLSLQCLVLSEAEIARSFDDFPDVAHKKRVEVLLAENRIARVGDDVGDSTRYAHVTQVQLSDNRLRLVKAVVCQLTVLFSRLETIRLEMPACDDD